MDCALDSRSNCPRSISAWGDCVMLLGKTLYSHSTHLQPTVQMDIGKFDAGTGWSRNTPGTSP